MKKSLTLMLLSFVLALGTPLSLPAQSRPKAAAAKPASAQTNAPSTAAKQPVAGPFHGKLAAVDKAAKTITVGKRTFLITPQTKLRKANQPATLDDAVVGEPCSGYVKPTEDGKWTASSVNLGPKADTKAGGKQGSSSKGQK